MPNLPKTAPEVKPFTYGRLRLALQRLYLALEPVYIPSLTRIAHLALWEDTKTSGIYCAVSDITSHNQLGLCILLDLLGSVVLQSHSPLHRFMGAIQSCLAACTSVPYSS